MAHARHNGLVAALLALLLLWIAPMALAQEGSDPVKAFGGFLSRIISPGNTGADKPADTNTNSLAPRQQQHLQRHFS